VSTSTLSELSEFFAFRWEGDPYELYRRVREAGPVQRHGESVVVCGHADVKETYRNAELFASGDDGLDGGPSPRQQRILDKLSPPDQLSLREIFGYERPTPVRSNGDEHRRLRGAVQRTFTARRVAAMREKVQELTDELLDSVDPDAPFDLVEVFAYRLPVLVILDIMGVPRADELPVRMWAAAIGANRGGVLPEAIEPACDAFRQFRAYLDGLIERYEAEPSDNLLSTLLDAQHEGRLTKDEVSSNVINVLFAGHETTSNLIGNGTLAMLRQREQWERLCADPGLAPSAVEELLRFESPVQYGQRRATEDTEIGGMPVAADTTVVTMIAAANRDPERFENPDRVDIGRPDNDQLGFGFGPHRCLGAMLAKVEGEVAFATLATRFPSIELVGPEPQWRPNRRLRGLVALPVRLRGRT
jgi:cytochrome P450